MQLALTCLLRERSIRFNFTLSNAMNVLQSRKILN
jgi:hypothetical protein